MSNTVKYITVTDENFETEVLNSDIPVVIDFWAPWCGPCRVMNPLIADIAEEFEGVVKVGKLNIDDHARLATRYGISAIPNLLFFNEGRVVDRLTGVAPKQVLSDKVNTLLKQQSLSNEKAA